MQDKLRLHYRPEIDGLRAVAILPVMLFHAGFEWFSGGYVGVDVFFVISGYLITSIILEEISAGRFSVAGFYERRARRILPALFFVLLGTTVAGWIWMVPSAFEEYSRALIAVVLFLSNVYFWRTEDYFEPTADLNPLLHTWSLAVEEQFYIVFPLFMLIAWRFGSGPTFWALAALSLLSLLLAEWGAHNRPSANFFLLPTRGWELGVGAACAFVRRAAPPRANALLSALGLALIVLSVLAFDAETPFPSLYATAPVGGAALIILCGGAGTPVARLLSLRLLVGIGLISYSAYLWHQPLFALARARTGAYPPPELMAALALATFPLAYLTWRFVEQPFRRRPTPVLASRGSVFAGSAVAAAALLGTGLHGQLSDGRLQVWKAANPDRAHVYGMHAAARRIRGVRLDDGACQFNVPGLDTVTIERLVDCRQRHGPGVAVLGDSHAIDLFNGLDALHEGAFIFGLTFAGCWLGTTVRECDLEGFRSLLRDQPGLFDQVIYHQAGYRFIRTDDAVATREIFERIPEERPIPADELHIFEQPIEQGIDYLAELSRITDVAWVGPRIEPHIGLAFMLNRGCDYPYGLREGQAALFQDLDRRLAAAAAAHDVTYVSLIEATGLDMPADFMTCDRLYWRDGDHWSVHGAAVFVRRLLQSGRRDGDEADRPRRVVPPDRRAALN
jgi:peptidoglycan/LPS O-acetylase OafA/YrhL